LCACRRGNHYIFFRLEASVATDVQELDAIACENATDEQAAVAIGRVLFAAHDGNPVHVGVFLQTSDSLAEKGCLGDAAVEDISIGVIERIALGAATQFLAHVAVLNPSALNRVFHLRVVKVRDVS